MNAIRKLFSVALSAALTLAGVASASAANVYWDPNGSGSWADGTRWLGGKAPGPNDVVRINVAVNAVVTDADWEFFSTLFEIILSNGAQLTFDMTKDVVFPGAVQGSRGTLMKLGSNRIVLSGTREATPSLQLAGGDIVVSNGCLKLTDMYAKSPSVLKVYKPGVIEMMSNADNNIGGLVGDGIVSNAVSSGTSGQLYFIGEYFARNGITPLTPAPWEFSGTFVNCAKITAGKVVDDTAYGPGDQRITSTTSTNLTSSSPRFNHGLLGLASIGNNGGTGPSSIGNYDTLSFNNQKADGETGVFYLGDGGTTSRAFDLYYVTLGGLTVFDGGVTGGLTFTGVWKNLTTGGGRVRPDGTASRMVIRGSNTTECVLANSLGENCATNALVLIKQGTGTWRMTADGTKANKGPIFVEKGTLAFDTIANRGEACSLGLSTLLSTNWYGAADVPLASYAYLLGDGTKSVDATTGTMAYRGGAVGACTNRPFAVRGAGRVADTGSGSLRLMGAYAAEPGVNSLVLSGTGADNCFSDVTNGVGQLKVVKEGTGSWRLAGNVALDGGVEVRSGTLRISNQFTWYRLNLRESCEKALFGFRLFGLWDAEGNLLTTGLTNNTGREALKFAAGETGSLTYETYPNGTRTWIGGALNYADVTDPLNPKAGNLLRCSASPNAVATDPSTWVRFAMHLPEGSAPAACYDMRAEEPSSTSAKGNEMKSFSMDASADGIRWTESVSSVDANDGWGVAGNWYSTKKSSRTAADGFRIAQTHDTVRTIAPLGSVSVAAGATLVVDPGVTANALVCEAAGGGTIDGLAFDEEGSFELKDGKLPLTVPMTLRNVTGLENVANWTVSVGGKLKAGARIVPGPDGFQILPSGLTIILK